MPSDELAPAHTDRPVGRAPSHLVDRDLSLMEFERRVLEEALDDRHPLLERVKFLGILGRNLDEFVMVRGKHWMSAPHAGTLIDTMHALLRRGQQALRSDLVPALAAEGVHLLDYGALGDDERADVDRRFAEMVFPHVVVRFLDEGSSPDAPALGLNYVVPVDDAELGRRLALVRVPDGLPSVLPVAPSPDRRRGGAYVWLDQVLLANLHRVCPGAHVEFARAFRLLRDADLVPATDGSGDWPSQMLDAVRQRATNPVMMMVVEQAARVADVERLARALGVEPVRTVRMPEVLDLKRLWDVSRIDRPDLRYPPLEPAIPPRVSGACMFSAIDAGDILLHHPYESFDPVVALLRQAADDPDVVSVSTTLYRTDRGESPVVEALVDAAGRGKDVRVVVELTARFDERHNAEWSRLLAVAGARVFHGRAGLKVHAKITLVVRREGSRLRRYAHISTGNYSSFTSKVYTDLALMTADDDITADVAMLFDIVTGREPARSSLRSALAAPFALRQAFQSLVEREMAWAGRGEPGHIVLKMNALVDPALIELLCRASSAGVGIDLIVRGICCLRPGVPGVSDRIRVRSVVGRFLEHSRVWYFGNGGHPDVFIGSADLMPRNLDRRVEILVPIKDGALARRVRDILDVYLADTRSARDLRRDGTYERPALSACKAGVCAQAALLETAVRTA